MKLKFNYLFIDFSCSMFSDQLLGMKICATTEEGITESSEVIIPS